MFALSVSGDVWNDESGPEVGINSFLRSSISNNTV